MLTCKLVYQLIPLTGGNFAHMVSRKNNNIKINDVFFNLPTVSDMYYADNDDNDKCNMFSQSTLTTSSATNRLSTKQVL